MEIKKNYIIVISSLLVTLLFTILLALPSPPPKEAQLKYLPKVVGKWQGEDQPIRDRIYSMLFDSDLLFRIYKNPQGESISFFVVASSTNLEAFHPPELCFGGVDAQFLKREIVQLTHQDKEFKITKLYIKHKDEEKLIIYWFKVGNKTTHHYYRHRVDMIIDRILLRRNIYGKVLITTPIKNGDIEAAFELVQGFIKEILPHLNKHFTG